MNGFVYICVWLAIYWVVVTVAFTIMEPPHSISDRIRAQWAAIRRVRW